jgi:hypothetical protein
MPAVFRIILSTVFGGVMGTVCWAAVFWTTEWFFSPETKKPLAVFSVVRGGPIGFVVGAIIGLVVLMKNGEDAISALLVPLGDRVVGVSGRSSVVSRQCEVDRGSMMLLADRG